MAEEQTKATQKKSKKPANPNPLLGNQAKPTILDNTVKLDIDTNKTLVDNIIEAGLSNQLNIGTLEDFTTISDVREQTYQLIDMMCQDSSVSSIVRTYAEDACEPADNGHIVWCESDDPKISKFVNYLLNVMNVDKNIYGWAYCLVKYGDIYLRLFRESDYDDQIFKSTNIDKAFSAKNTLNESLDESINLNVHKANDPYSYYVEMVPDPSTMFELTKYGKTYGYIEVPNSEFLSNSLYGITNPSSDVSTTNTIYAYKMKSGDVNIFQADDFAHAYLDDNFSRTPEKIDLFTTDTDYNSGLNSTSYTVKRGKSMLYDAYKVWREKQLLESSILLNRITRSSIIRKVQVEVGDMPKEQAKQTLRRVKELFEQKAALNTTGTGLMNEYNNPGPIENCIYFPTHGGQGAITVDSVGGDVNVKDLTDLDDWNNKFYSSFGIPKQYFGWTEDGAGFNGGTSLTILSSVYAKGVRRIQNALIQMITDTLNLILLNKGCRSYLNNFEIHMKVPTTQEEKDYREALTNKVNAISNMQGLFSDIEDKGRRLTILKALVSDLHYSDQITTQIDEEIKAYNEQIEAEKAEGKEGESAPESSEDNDLDGLDLGGLGGPSESGTSERPEPPESKEPDLGDTVDMAAIGNNESFTSTGGTLLTEDNDTEKVVLDALTEADVDLPTPEDLNQNIDFTQNK